ncbi:uncharacterized protein LOC131680660 [Topomyia yanbarensis]|uniref:uncharacterized protein LOC131680660 n=1 Tax=Topomyia yanbarensis TaxID=2498891 RepID=UPI00273AC13B|nr:uncharacterized protein LOC131680660 [Topomyia yanbarensis]
MSKQKITMFFFTNGEPLKAPHKVVVERQKLEKNEVVKRVNKLHFYNGYVVYTLFGEVLRSIKEIHNESAFVVVPRDKCFKPGPYLKAFRNYIDEKLPTIKETKHAKSDKKGSVDKKPFAKTSSTPKQLTKVQRSSVGCRHAACEAASAKHGGSRSGSCDCQKGNVCTLNPSQPKTKVKRKKKVGGGWSMCFRKNEEKKEPTVRLRKRDLARIEKEKAKKVPKAKHGWLCFGRKPTRAEYYRKNREKLIKQRNERIANEEKRKVKDQKALKSRIKSRKRKQECMALYCPCCAKKPEPLLVPPPPHNCIKHMQLARDEACRRRRALRTQEQPSWESITVPPMTKKRIRGTQTTKNDLKRAHKASGGGGWNCLGGSKKKKVTNEHNEEYTGSIQPLNKSSLTATTSARLEDTEADVEVEVSRAHMTPSRTSVPISVTNSQSRASSKIIEDVLPPESKQTMSVTFDNLQLDTQSLPEQDVEPSQDKIIKTQSFDHLPTVQESQPKVVPSKE